MYVKRKGTDLDIWQWWEGGGRDPCGPPESATGRDSCLGSRDFGGPAPLTELTSNEGPDTL